MKDFLVRHALANVWCNPYQDRQAIIQLRASSKHGGVRRYFTYLRNTIYLPTKNDYYYIYPIGNSSHTRLNLPVDKIDTWIKLSDLCMQRSILAELYSENGLMFCRSLAYLMYTSDRGFIIAVRKQDAIANLDDVTLFLRLQSNSFFQSARDVADPDNIEMGGIELTQTNINSFLNFQFEYQSRRDSGVGHAYAFKNGRYVSDWLPNNVRAGDILEWVYDTSVKETHDFFLDEIPNFQSELDTVRKLLAHPPKSVETIDYRDDIDVYIIKYNPDGNRFDGIYYHKNHEKSIRMVTHRDYSFPEDQVAAYVEGSNGWDDTQNIAIRIHIKNSGYSRPLIDEHNRIREMYNRLDDQGIVDAMVGLDSVLTEWQAAELEKSMYTKIMRSTSAQVTPTIVASAYGYNAMAKVTADTPSKLVNGSVQLPVGLQEGSTVFEYNTNGLLLGWRHHVAGVNYYPENDDCVMVEVLGGRGTLDGGFTFGNAPVVLDIKQSHRFYVCPVVNGVPNENWQDVTGNTDIVTISGGVATWNLTADSYGCVKSTSEFTCYDFEVESDDWTYKLSVDRTEIGTPLNIPARKLDVFMNGRALVKDIDYYLKWPQLYIVNKKYLKPGNYQSLTVRATGFCNPDLSMPVTGEVGYVYEGFVSVDNEYDVRDDKIVRCVVGGKLYHRSEIDFEEDHRLFTVPRVTNGLPYSIETVEQPVGGVLDYTAFPLIDRSHDMDTRVGNYLTANLPPVVIPGNNPIPSLYPVVSPLIARLAWEMTTGITDPLPSTASDMELQAFMADYTSYLDYDPAYNEMNLAYVVIHPHPFTDTVEVSSEAYSFLERIIRMYLDSRIDITPFVTIALGE